MQSEIQLSNLPIAILISGGGTTLRNLISRVATNQLPVTIRLVISSCPDARGLDFAREAAIDTRVIERHLHANSQAFSDAVFNACRDYAVSLVAMGGFLKYLPIPLDYTNRVVNIHPSLIPAFCGKGMYGTHVHEAVLAYGARISGCTVHFVDNKYDHGPIISQIPVSVEQDDTPETLAARVFRAECEAYPQAIQWIAEDRLRVVGRQVIRS